MSKRKFVVLVLLLVICLLMVLFVAADISRVFVIPTLRSIEVVVSPPQSEDTDVAAEPSQQEEPPLHYEMAIIAYWCPGPPEKIWITTETQAVAGEAGEPNDTLYFQAAVKSFGDHASIFFHVSKVDVQGIRQYAVQKLEDGDMTVQTINGVDVYTQVGSASTVEPQDSTTIMPDEQGLFGGLDKNLEKSRMRARGACQKGDV